MLYRCKISKFSPAVLSKSASYASPCLKAKARATCYVIEWLASVSALHTSSELKRQRACLLWACDTLFRVFRDGNFKLSAGEVTLISHCRDVYCDAAHFLASSALAARNLKWHVLPKSHSLMEICLFVEQTHCNPAVFWCWKEEDHVGKMCRVAKKVHKQTMNQSVALRYLDELRLKFS